MEGNHPCDIYFLDIGLPGVNGMEAAQIIRQTDESTPIVFVTDLAQYAVRGYSVDALDFHAQSPFTTRTSRCVWAARCACWKETRVPP